jgi:DNA-binding transcriptional LysR family regulator
MLYFCTIVEQGQISRAARVLHMAQPPLSQRLREMEDEFGCELFERKGRRLQLTEAGRLFYPRAREILRLVDETRDEVIRVASQSGPSLRIGLSPTCRSFWLARVQAVREQFSGRQIGLVVGDSSYLEYLLETGKLDLALMQPPVHAGHFALYPLASSRTVAVAARGLLTSDVGAVSLHELSRHPLLLLRRSVGVGSYERLLQLLHDAGLHPNVAFYSSDVDMLLDMLRRGFAGIAIVPESETGALGADWPVRTLEVDLPDYQLSLVCRRGEPDEALSRQLLACWGGEAEPV